MISIFYIIVASMLFLIIYKSHVKGSAFYSDANPEMLALSITVLCVVGMHQIFGKIEFDFVLLPYGALAIALLSVLLLGWLSKFRKSKDVNFEEETGETALKTKKNNKFYNKR